MLSASDKAAVNALAGHYRLAAEVFLEVAWRPSDVAFDEKQIAQALGLPPSHETGVLEVLRVAESLKLVASAPSLRWRRAGSEADLLRISSYASAVTYYKEHVHRDATRAQVVLTKPAKPSRLEDALSELGWKVAEIEPTSEAFCSLASSAERRLVVMTPFLDAAGADWLVNLFERTALSVERILILRYLGELSHPGYPSGFTPARWQLQQLGVKIFDYSLPRAAGGMETFHAKVVVRDNDQVYVGSSNMNRASLEYSMELGVLLSGEGAAAVSRVISAILSVARRL